MTIVVGALIGAPITILGVALFGLSLVTTPVGTAVASVRSDRIASVVGSTSPHWGRSLVQ